MKPYLALFRAGPGSLHSSAIERLDQQNFDYALSWYGDTPPEAPGAAFVHLQKGAKWPGLRGTLAACWDTIAQYRQIWLPDDDLLCQPESVSRMFLMCDELGLELAQPALTPDSYFAHPITLQHAQFQLRFTNFVEIMAPVLSVELLARVFPTLDGAISGYGLDSLWPRMSQLGKVAILDETPVKHTRPLGGPNYKFSAQAGLTPVQEEWLVCAGHFIEGASDVHLNLAGLLQDGNAICLGSTPTELDVMLEALMTSLQGIRVPASQLTRYLANHLQYWQGEQGRPRYPRAVLAPLLKKALAPVGIRFQKPEPRTAVESGALARPGLN
jgi:hypothetical protein